MSYVRFTRPLQFFMLIHSSPSVFVDSTFDLLFLQHDCYYNCLAASWMLSALNDDDLPRLIYIITTKISANRKKTRSHFTCTYSVWFTYTFRPFCRCCICCKPKCSSFCVIVMCLVMVVLYMWLLLFVRALNKALTEMLMIHSKLITLLTSSRNWDIGLFSP